MKRVQFTRDMRPQAAGSERILPDEDALRLEGEGAVRILGNWPADVPQAEVAKPRPQPSLLGRRQSYKTK